jgi:hypothetical protein
LIAGPLPSPGWDGAKWRFVSVSTLEAWALSTLKPFLIETCEAYFAFAHPTREDLS